MSELHWYQSDKDLWKYLRRHDCVLELRRRGMFLRLGLGGYVNVVVRPTCRQSPARNIQSLDRVGLSAFSTGRVYIALNHLFEAVAENFDQVIPILSLAAHRLRVGEFRTLLPMTKYLEMPERKDQSHDLLPFQAACRAARREKFLRQLKVDRQAESASRRRFRNAADEADARFAQDVDETRRILEYDAQIAQKDYDAS